MICLHLRAPQDTNGNPRRLWLILDQHGDVEAVFDEGYRGDAAVRKHYRRAKWGPVIDVTATEYRAWKKSPRYRGEG